jgi:hypothetical protein
MFGKSKPKPTATPTTQSDQYRLKSTGQRVTLLRHLSGDGVRIAMDTNRSCREDIVSIHDITPA